MKEWLCALSVREEKAETCFLTSSMLHPQPPFMHATSIRQMSKIMKEGGGRVVPFSPHQKTVGVLASKGWVTPL